MAGLDEPNFDLFTTFKIDFLDDEGIAAADPQSNKRILLAFCFVAQMKLTLAFL